MKQADKFIGGGALLTIGLLASCSGLGGTVAERPEIVWKPSQVVVQGTKDYSPPSVTVDRSGRVILAWIEKEKLSERGAVRLLSLTAAGRAESGPATVNPADKGPDATHLSPGLSAGSDGQIYLTWSVPKFDANNALRSDLVLARSLDGGRSFEAPRVINDDDTPSSHGFEGISAAPDGAINVSWLDGREKQKSGAGTYFARSTDQGDTFTPNVKVDGGSCPCCRPSTVTTADGTIVVSWRKVFEGNVRDIVIARSTDGGRSFSSPERVRKDDWAFPACPHRGPSLAADAQGRVYLTWYTEGADEQPRIYFVTSDDAGRTFSSPLSLHTATPSLPDQPKMAIFPNGVVLVVWEEVTGVHKRVVMRFSTDRGATFSAAQILSDGPQGSNPAVAIHPSGLFAIVWNERAFPNNQIVVQTGTFHWPSRERGMR
ncbi:MAG TPA: sialidase family protein [Nitrospiria bacterium]|jgi:hypothetical protein|nr:sialidase family protein [Nitrospiria bacterium]